MITESAPLIIYPIRKQVPSYLSSGPRLFQLVLVIFYSILIIHPKNLANVPFVVTPIPLKYFCLVPSLSTYVSLRNANLVPGNAFYLWTGELEVR